MPDTPGQPDLQKMAAIEDTAFFRVLLRQKANCDLSGETNRQKSNVESPEVNPLNSVGGPSHRRFYPESELHFRQKMKMKIIGLVVGLILTPIALFFAVASAGAGHGDYVVARVLFPLTILSTYLTESIGAVGITIACIQFPLYGWLLGRAAHLKKKAPLVLIPILHGVLAGLSFAFPSGFSR